MVSATANVSSDAVTASAVSEEECGSKQEEAVLNTAERVQGDDVATSAASSGGAESIPEGIDAANATPHVQDDAGAGSVENCGGMQEDAVTWVQHNENGATTSGMTDGDGGDKNEEWDDRSPLPRAIPDNNGDDKSEMSDQKLARSPRAEAETHACTLAGDACAVSLEQVNVVSRPKVWKQISFSTVDLPPTPRAAGAAITPTVTAAKNTWAPASADATRGVTNSAPAARSTWALPGAGEWSVQQNAYANFGKSSPGVCVCVCVCVCCVRACAWGLCACACACACACVHVCVCKCTLIYTYIQ
jgi:hypothetical protein